MLKMDSVTMSVRRFADKDPNPDLKTVAAFLELLVEYRTGFCWGLSDATSGKRAKGSDRR